MSMQPNFSLEWNGKRYRVGLQNAVSLAIPVGPGQHPRAWHAPKLDFSPVVDGGWVGEVASGAPVNFRNTFLNPHGHATHTESLGHISTLPWSAFEAVPKTWLMACLVSAKPEPIGGDFVIYPQQLQEAWIPAEALILRTLPNSPSKLQRDYSGSNPPYLHPDCGPWLLHHKVQHLLLDLPSVDRESDEGKLSVHHSFWGWPQQPRKACSITELIFVPNELPDGLYLLQLCVLPWINDAAPSIPLLYPLNPMPHGD